MEEWKPIKDFVGVYDVSTNGRIRSYLNNRHGICDNSKIIKGSLGKNGYYTVSLYNPTTQKRKRLLVHRIVAQSFIPNPDNKGFVDHINTNRIDNRVENLRWVTQRENNQNSITVSKIIKTCRAYGITHRGSNSASAKPVGQYTLVGSLVGSFGSVVEASEKTGISLRKITHNIHGEQSNADGFLFRFL